MAVTTPGNLVCPVERWPSLTAFISPGRPTLRGTAIPQVGRHHLNLAVLDDDAGTGEPLPMINTAIIADIPKQGNPGIMKIKALDK